jgi:hypothetical protein
LEDKLRQKHSCAEIQFPEGSCYRCSILLTIIQFLLVQLSFSGVGFSRGTDRISFMMQSMDFPPVTMESRAIEVNARLASRPEARQ